MMKIFFLCLTVVLFIPACNQKQNDLTSYVDPMIGTTRGGNQVPGPHCPFGLMELTPVTKAGISSTVYESGDSLMYGFSLVNIIGSGCSSYGSVLIAPVKGEPDTENKMSRFENEAAKVGYYSVFMADHNIKAEATSLVRSSILRFTLPKGTSSILFDLSRVNTQDTLFRLKWISETELEGARTDGQFCGKPGVHKLYFYVKLNGRPAVAGMLKNNMPDSAKELNVKNDKIAAFAKYLVETDSLILEVRSAVSYVSTANAKMNLEKEIAEKTFEDVRKECVDSWNSMLSRIEVEGGSDTDKIKFYTALYHTMSHPNILNDVNGEYPAMETMKTMKAEGRNRFTLYSLWDTYRTLHPFFTLAYPEIQSQMVKSMLDIYREYGWLPHWECISREKGVMNGDPALVVINDSWQKGIRDFDAEEALQAMIHNTKEVYIYDESDRKKVEYIRKAKDAYWQYGGYIPQDYKEKGGDVWGVVATTEEYNIADWNLAQFAKSLGKEDVYNTYLKLSQGYKFFYDSVTKFMRRRYADGRWTEPFDPFNRTGEMSWYFSGGPGYTEGHAWHYLFFMPHDIKGMIQLMGGEKAFIDRLQLCFDSSYYMPDNEPDIAYPFLFNYVKGEEWRTQLEVRKLIEKEFRLGFDGIPGNDDTGTMSAWLLLAMMGIYPDCPGSLNYQICAPVFDKITIHLTAPYQKGKKFVIQTRNNSRENTFIKSVMLNGTAYDSYQLSHNDIVNGGEMIIELSKEKR